MVRWSQSQSMKRLLWVSHVGAGVNKLTSSAFLLQYALGIEITHLQGACGESDIQQNMGSP